MRTFLIALAASCAFAAAATGAADAPMVVAKIRVAPATSPCAAAAGAGFVWVSEYSSPYLLKINPKTNKVVKKIRVGNGSCGLGFGAGSLWVEDTSSNTISRVSTATGKRTAAIEVGLQPYDSTFAYGADWATSYGNGELDRIDPSKNRVVKRFTLGSAIGVVGAFGSVWATGDQGVLAHRPRAQQGGGDDSRRRSGLDGSIGRRGVDYHLIGSRPHRPGDEHRRRDDQARVVRDRRSRCRRRPRLGAADSREHDCRRRSGDQCRCADYEGRKGAVRRDADRGRGMGPELEGHRHLANQAVSVSPSLVGDVTAEVGAASKTHGEH